MVTAFGHTHSKNQSQEMHIGPMNLSRTLMDITCTERFSPFGVRINGQCTFVFQIYRTQPVILD